MSFVNIAERLEAGLAQGYENYGEIKEKARAWNYERVHRRVGRHCASSLFVQGGQNKGVAIVPRTNGVLVTIVEGFSRTRTHLPMFDASIDISKGEHSEVTSISAWHYRHDGDSTVDEKRFFESYGDCLQPSLSVATLVECIKYAKETVQG